MLSGSTVLPKTVFQFYKISVAYLSRGNFTEQDIEVAHLSELNLSSMRAQDLLCGVSDGGDFRTSSCVDEDR